MQHDDLGTAYLTDALRSLRCYKRLAEEALVQTSDQDLFRLIDAEANSIAIIIKHMAGNMRSRWTDFLTSDGEKPNRNRDQEFILAPDATRADVMRCWESGWAAVFNAITPLTCAELLEPVIIAGRQHTVLQAINRQMLHYAGHVNQIVLLAKHFRGPAWKTLSIPKNQSAKYVREYEDQHAARRR